MKILLVHNRYKIRGGEDMVFEEEQKLLREMGNEVFVYEKTNESIEKYSIIKKIYISLHNPESYADILDIVEHNHIDIVHFHNIQAVISPSAVLAAKKAGAATVMTIHNFRHSCIKATFFRDGHICELCSRKKVPTSGIINRCYQDSYVSSVGASINHSYKSITRVLDRNIDKYIVLSDFSRQKLIHSGVSPEKIAIKPNFSQRRGITKSDKTYFLYVGRISEEKGIKEFAEIWAQSDVNEKLYIIGDGPQANLLPVAKNIVYLGKLNHDDVIKYMISAKAIIFPSKWYEGMPMTIIEAFSNGIPVIANKIGVMKEMIIDDYNGFLLDLSLMDSVGDIIEKFKNPSDVARYSRNAIDSYDKKYTPDKSYEVLMDIYRNLLKGGK